MEVNGEAVVLAGGITEATAYAIVSDINRIFEW
jgi:NaMN:DMB phosphoribosyltransferase